MKIQVSEEYIKKIQSNEFLKKMVKEYGKSIDEDKSTEFLEANPEFVQMMMHWASSDEIKITE